VANEPIPLPAKVLNTLATLGLIGVAVLFLSPLVIMFLHHLEVAKAQREWQETIARENAKTDKAVRSFQEAVAKAKAGRTK
jgi:hypothetical protein